MTSIASLKREVEILHKALVDPVNDWQQRGRETSAVLWVYEALIELSRLQSSGADTAEAEAKYAEAVANYKTVDPDGSLFDFKF